MERSRKIKPNFSWQRRIWSYRFKIITIFPIVLFHIPFLYGNLSSKSEQKMDYFFLDAIRSWHKNKYTRSFNDLIYCTQIDSTSSVVWYELAKHYTLLHKENQALNALQKAIHYDFNNFEYKFALANLNEKIGNYDAAIILYEELLKIYPSDIKLYYQLSYLYGQKNYSKKTIEMLDKIEQNIGIDETISIKLYILYQSLGEAQKAIKKIESLAEEFPTETKYKVLIGNFFLNRNETDKAIQYYQEALSTDPNNLDCVEALLYCYKIQGDQDLAIQKIEKIVKNQFLDPNIKFNIFKKYVENIWDLKKEKEKINQLFSILIRQYENNKTLNQIYGKFLLSQNKIKEAKIQFQIITEALPNNSHAWIELLNIAIQEEKPDEIIEICNKALSHIPKFPEMYFYQGIAFYIKKLYWQALSSYQKGFRLALKKDSSLKSSFAEQIGSVYYQIGNKKKAFYFYKKATLFNSKNYLNLNNYAYSLALNNIKLNKAKKMAAETVLINPDNLTYLDTYSYVFFKKKMYTLAKFYIEHAISKSTIPNSEMLEHYGDILYKIGEKDKAILEWKKSFLLKKTNQEKSKFLQKNSPLNLL